MIIQDYATKLWVTIKENPWSVLGWFLAVSVSVYSLIPDKRQVSYWVENPQLIFNKASMPGNLTLVDTSGSINKNVYFINVLLSNSGDLPIDKQSLRDTFQIQIDATSRILDAGVSEQSDAEIFDLKIRFLNNKLTMDWQHFDPSYKAKLYIVAESETVPQVEIYGKALGMSSLTNDSDHSSRRIVFYVVSLALSVVMTIIVSRTITPITTIITTRLRNVNLNFQAIIFVICICIMFAIVVAISVIVLQLFSRIY